MAAAPHLKRHKYNSATTMPQHCHTLLASAAVSDGTDQMTMTQNMVCELPSELLCSIISFLPLKDLLLHVSHVCRLWRQALQHPMCWSNIHLQRKDLTSSFNSLKRSWPAILGRRSCVTSFVLERWITFSRPLAVGPCCRRYFSAGLMNQLSAMKRIQSLTLTLPHALTGDLRLAWSNLVLLNIRETCPCFSQHVQPATPPDRLDLSACSSLQTLHISKRKQPLVVVVCGLKHLSKMSVWAPWLHQIDGLFSLPSLSSLSLWECSDVHVSESDLSLLAELGVVQREAERGTEGEEDSEESITASSCLMRCLTHLNIGGTNSHFASVFLRNASHMPNLEEVELPSGVHMPELGYLAECMWLHALTLREQSRLTEQDMYAVGSIPSLRRLEFVLWSGHGIPLHTLCDTPSSSVLDFIAFHISDGLVGSDLNSVHMLSSLEDLHLITCDGIDTLPSSLAHCASLTHFSWCVDDTTSLLTLENTVIIASIPHLQGASLPHPSSEQCVQTIAQCPELEDLYFQEAEKIPSHWLDCLPPAIKAFFIAQFDE